ncbi:MAG TPA: phytanoyl-CoA dioxygenase family protein [Verrucomicrobiae bacterium]|nr:phytanoyl-CoA dioxygenase family protein [Verrucomicrobiae bacterium]
MNSEFTENGFQIFPAVISDQQCDLLALELSAQFETYQNSAKSRIGGVRNLLQNRKIAEIASSLKLTSILDRVTDKRLFPVRAIFFDKTAESNWRVPWHQDFAIAVAEKIETLSFTGWSIKDEVLHVHPPRKILENMVTVRMHLDDCNSDNGALKVIPGSHLNGKLSSTQIGELTSKEKSVVCEISKGGALLMRPLILHSSSPAKNPSHRRVLHIEFAADELPNGLKWFERR